MCANYRPAAGDALARYRLPIPDFPYGETYPGGVAPILTRADPHRWTAACFGLVPFWAKDATIAKRTYNARTETVGEKPSFRNAWKRRQTCIIPAECYFEPCYESGKAVRWVIRRVDGQPFGIAGIWEHRSKDDLVAPWSMSMLTINADEHPLMRRFHKPGDEKRSVVVLSDHQWDDWLSAADDSQMRAMLQPFDPALMEAEAAPKTTPRRSGRTTD